MENVLVQVEIELDRFEQMSDKYKYLSELGSYYFGKVVNLTFDKEVVIVDICAPSTWRYLWMEALFLPYRYN